MSDTDKFLRDVIAAKLDGKNISITAHLLILNYPVLHDIYFWRRDIPSFASGKFQEIIDKLRHYERANPPHPDPAT